ncbi:MAG: hypothetical protein JNK64_16995 [Myxococcales bacterium]|nr:hypothetical protein [Myxococcales bacterium]
MNVRALGVLAVVASCGSDDAGPYCGAHELLRDQRSSLCTSAHELAKRATTAIIASQEEIDTAEALIRTTLPALRPTFAWVPRAAPWYQTRGLVELVVTDPGIEAAWANGLAPSGNEVVDRVVQELDVWDFSSEVYGPGGHSYALWSRGAPSAPNVREALQGVAGVEVIVWSEFDPNATNVVDEGIDPADGARAVTYSIGWEDCAVGCHFAHHWRTKVGADGTAWLVTDWGDDLPAALVEGLATPEPML